LQFDDVEQYANVAAFPATGEAGKLYIDISTNSLYRWDGSDYIAVIEVADILDLGDIPDVNVTGLADNYILKYDSGTSKWIVVDHKLNEIEDVTITSATNGQVLTWNGTAWVNAAIPTQALNDLTDVVVATPAENNLLVYDGSNFVNQAGSSTLVGLNNVQNFGIATQAEAEAGTADNKYMTPERTAQAIAELETIYDDSAVTSHIADTTIHFTKASLVKADVGLDNVDNTADANKFVAGVVETRNSDQLSFWQGDQDQYDAIGTKNANTIYLITE
jgi:hypothetical protein